MTGRQPYAEQCTRVYTRTGQVAHLMSPVQSIRSGSVLCDRVLPEWFTEWHGTGSQAETEHAASLPTCKRCEDQAKREDGYYSEPPQFTPDPAGDARPRRTSCAAVPGGPGSASPPAEPGGKTSPQAGSPTPLPEGTQTPAGARIPDPAGGKGRAPAGSSGEEFRKRLKAAQSAHNAAKRRGRVRRAPKQAGPGMIRRLPPETPGDAA